MLKKAYLEITNTCNLSCSFCHKTKRHPHFLTTEEFDLLTNKLQGKIKYLYFHLMGEPLLHPNLPDFISTAKNKGFLPIITTNGSLLAQRGYELLIYPPHKVSISLHAPAANPAFSDESYLENCIKFAKKAAKMGCYIAFRLWNLGSDDEAENTHILNKLHSEFVGEWSTIRNGCGNKLSDGIYLEFAKRFDWPDSDIAESPEDTDMFCYGLRDQIGILCDGTVVPCCLDADGNIPLGNLLHTDLDSIINSKRAKNIYNGFSQRHAVEPLCRKCGYAKRFGKKI